MMRGCNGSGNMGVGLEMTSQGADLCWLAAEKRCGRWRDGGSGVLCCVCERERLGARLALCAHADNWGWAWLGKARHWVLIPDTCCGVDWADRRQWGP